MYKVIYRKVSKYLTLKTHITVYLDCGHTLIDYVKNKWNIDDKISCPECLSQFKILEMFVTDLEE